VAPASGAKPVRAPSAPLSAASRPNILLIVVDTLRYDSLSLAGRDDDASPQIATLARSGISFGNAYSTWDETAYSHFSLLTGFTAGANSELNRASLSIAQQLKEAGYHTFGTAANLQLSKKAIPVVTPFDDYVCLGDEWESMTRAQQNALARETDPIIQQYRGRLTAFNRLMMYSNGNRVLQSIEDQLRQRGSKPFFGFVNIVDAHDPYFPDPKWYDLKIEEGKLPVPPSFDGDVRNRNVPTEMAHPEQIADPKRRQLLQTTIGRVGNRAWSTTFDLNEQALAIYRHRYDAKVRHADAIVGGLIRLLRNEGLLSSTIVIVTSDHGESFGEASLITHAFGNTGDFESTHHVPLVWSFPPSYHAPSHSSDVFVSIADVAPTIYDLLRIDWMPIAKQAAPNPGMFGKSLVPYLLSPAMKTSGPVRPASTGSVAQPDRAAQDRSRERRLRSLGYIQ
jgi:arylsulfatase A-like enzyme